MFPQVGCRGPQSEFFVNAENKTCIDMHRICLAVEICIYQSDGKDKLKAADVDLTFAKNTLHSFFSQGDVSKW